MHAAGVSRRGVEVHPEFRAFDQILAAVAGEGADAQFGALKVGKDADRPTGVSLYLADDLVAGGDIVMCAVAHIQAEHIGSGFEQGADCGVIVGCRPQCGHDLYIAKASHACLVP